MIAVINIDNTYDLITAAPDLSEATFYSHDKSGKLILLKIIIMPLDYPFLPGVYNLSFGPQNEDNSIDDNARIFHQDQDKMFSTIILFALAFLKKYPNNTIGLDGSNDVRAYLYHRMFITNKEYLKNFFVALGADWFVRLLRNGDYEVDSKGEPFFKPKPELFDYQRSIQDLYRYYMFHLAK